MRTPSNLNRYRLKVMCRPKINDFYNILIAALNECRHPPPEVLCKIIFNAEENGISTSKGKAKIYAQRGAIHSTR
jgi:hypothetical protein